jgi:hypothetical protein
VRWAELVVVEAELGAAGLAEEVVVDGDDAGFVVVLVVVAGLEAVEDEVVDAVAARTGVVLANAERFADEENGRIR